MGSVIAGDLARSRDVDNVLLADLDADKLEVARKKFGNRKFSTEILDVSQRTRLIRLLRDFDVAAAALPHGAVHLANRAAVAAGTKMVDIAFEDAQMGLHLQAKRTGALLIPGCGVAPGLAGILVAHAARKMTEAGEAQIAVGGIPQKPTPPLGYKLVFSMKGLLREYLTKARIIRDGKLRKVDPFDHIEKMFFPPPVGECEAFYTDGLGSLLYSMSHLRNLDEKTVRWPGHAEKIKFLIESGFFSKEQVEVAGRGVSPYEFTSSLLNRVLTKGSTRDLTVMRVRVKGRNGEQNVETDYEMMDFYDENKDITSMGRTTGFTCAAVTRLVGLGSIRRKGVVPPEIALDDGLTTKLLAHLTSRGIRINTVRK
jgi:lysine 6-dehydrogenase